MSEIVRGRTVHATLSYDRVELEIVPEDHDKVFLGANYLLVPDDGTHRVVGVEEWERRGTVPAVALDTLQQIAKQPCLTALLGEDPEEQGCMCAGCHARMTLTVILGSNGGGE